MIKSLVNIFCKLAWECKKAAGVLYFCDDKILLIKRSSLGDYNGYWAIPGGKVESGESYLEGAKRECKEEIGKYHAGKNLGHYDFEKKDFTYRTHFVRVDKEFEPKLNDEHTEYKWADINKLPKKVHPGLLKTLDNLSFK